LVTSIVYYEQVMNSTRFDSNPEMSISRQGGAFEISTQPFYPTSRIIFRGSQNSKSMQPQDNLNNPSGDTGGIVCSQCGAPMPTGMRFCRACGHRLGEGPAEYTETVRFPNATAMEPQGASFTPNYAAPIAQQPGEGVPYKKKRRISGMAWIVILIGALFVLGGVLTAVRRSVRRAPFSASVSMPRSYFGVNGFEDATGGVTFDNVEPPGSPADKAGLVGGDVITTFDGRAVTDEDEMSQLLRQTPTGKTVEVTYIRDGETRKTQLTTMSQGEFNELQRVYGNRPEGRGYFGFDDDRVTKIADPATRTYGVRLDYVERNGPAELFGLQVGDIITSFDGVPIRTGEELLSRVRRAVPKKPVEVTVIRGAETLKIPVTIGRG
jgi:membrane-associated protease RseP (regulator of RpoE activity)